MGSGAVAVAPLAKNVVVYRNGDPFFLGRKFVVSQRRFLTFEAFLNEVTSSIQAPMAVRSIYTPRQGHRVADLGELQNGGRYVAAGFERFKKLNYLNPGMKQLSKHLPKKGVQNYPNLPQKGTTVSQWKRQGSWPCVIYVFRNGDLLSPPFRLILTKSTRQEWDVVLTRLSEKANLRSGPVKKLCKLNGDLVSRAEELVNGEYYVAVGVEKYKDLPYFELLVPPQMSYLWKIPAHRRRILKQELGEFYLASQEGTSDSVLLEPAQPGFQMKLRRVQSTGIVQAGSGPNSSVATHTPAKKHPHREKAASIFHAKPAQLRQLHQNSLSSSDQENESVYKKKGARQEVADAQEIGEDEETQVEFPVDQKAAETVEEEVMPKAKGGPSHKPLISESLK